jgi:isopentenyl-diphosphate delta-isomerase
MDEVTPLSTRKSDHIRINLEEDTHSGLTTGLENFHFIHRAVPELNFTDIDTSQVLFGKKIGSPILISSMTGGTDQANNINRILATAAQEMRIAMGVGSQRIAIEHPEDAHSFQVRKYAPDILLFANLGAIQLNYGYGRDECLRAIDMIEADALVLHFNSLQEAIQKEGQTQFAGLMNKVEAICKEMPVPVIAKEVGWGFSKQDIKMLVDAGISAVDIAGAGGTSWSQVEMHRSEDKIQRQLAAAFIDWGIPTANAIQIAVDNYPSLIVIASGGLRSGIDIAKCIALGARMGGMASPFLQAASTSLEETLNIINLHQQEIRLCMFATGSKYLDDLMTDKLVRR